MGSTFPHKLSGIAQEHCCPPSPHYNYVRILWTKNVGYYIRKWFFFFRIEFCPYCGTHLPRPYDGPDREQEMRELRKRWER